MSSKFQYPPLPTLDKYKRFSRVKNEETTTKHYEALQARWSGATQRKAGEIAGVGPGRIGQLEQALIRRMRERAIRAANAAMVRHQRLALVALQWDPEERERKERMEYLRQRDEQRQLDEQRQHERKQASIIAAINNRDVLRREVCKTIIALNRYASETGDKRFHENMTALSFALTANDQSTKARIENKESEIRTRLDNVIAAAADLATQTTGIA
jgi:hypothetical protein